MKKVWITENGSKSTISLQSDSNELQDRLFINEVSLVDKHVLIVGRFSDEDLLEIRDKINTYLKTL